jgi:hypothetical protein
MALTSRRLRAAPRARENQAISFALDDLGAARNKIDDALTAKNLTTPERRQLQTLSRAIATVVRQARRTTL